MIIESNNITDKIKSALNSNKSVWYIAFLVFSLNMILKAVFIDKYSIWYDECFSIFHSQLPLDKIIETSKWDANPPFYNMVLHYWVNLFGISPLSARMMSLFFGALAGGLLFIFCDKKINRMTAIIASALFLCSNELYFYAHEARCFSFILFLFIGSSYTFISLIFNPKIWKVIFLGVINFCLFYTHYLTGFIFLIQFIIALASYKSIKGMLYYFASNVIFLLFLIHWIPRLIEIISAKNGVGWLLPPTALDFYGFCESIMFGKIGVLVFILILITSIVVLFKTKKIASISIEKKMILLYFGLSSFLIIALNILCSHFLMPMFLARYVLFTIPAFFIFIAYLFSLTDFDKKIIYSTTCLLFILGLFQIEWNPNKHMDYNNAMKFIKKNKEEGTMVFMQSKDLTSLFAYYYDKEIFTRYNELPVLLEQEAVYLGNDDNDLKNINFNEFNKVILVQTFEDGYDPNKTVYNTFNSKFALIDTLYSLEGVKVSVFKNNNSHHSEIFSKLHLNIGSEYSFIIHKILNDDAWFNNVKANSKLAHISVLEQLFIEADYVISERIKNTTPEIQNMISKIKSDANWFNQVSDRALQQGHSIEEQLLLEAKYVLEMNK